MDSSSSPLNLLLLGVLVSWKVHPCDQILDICQHNRQMKAVWFSFQWKCVTGAFLITFVGSLVVKTSDFYLISVVLLWCYIWSQHWQGMEIHRQKPWQPAKLVALKSCLSITKIYWCLLAPCETIKDFKDMYISRQSKERISTGQWLVFSAKLCLKWELPTGPLSLQRLVVPVGFK